MGVLGEPLSYEEVAKVCSSLKSGISGFTVAMIMCTFVLLGLPFAAFYLNYTANFFLNFSVYKSLKIGLILPLFIGKGAKANNKDNYLSITLFHTLCKIYEMILLNRLEKFAAQRGYFPKLQLGFSEG